MFYLQCELKICLSLPEWVNILAFLDIYLIMQVISLCLYVNVTVVDYCTFEHVTITRITNIFLTLSTQCILLQPFRQNMLKAQSPKMNSHFWSFANPCKFYKSFHIFFWIYFDEVIFPNRCFSSLKTDSSNWGAN